MLEMIRHLTRKSQSAGLMQSKPYGCGYFGCVTTLNDSIGGYSMKAILTRGKIDLLTGRTVTKFSIKVTTCHGMFDRLTDIKAFLHSVSSEWLYEADGEEYHEWEHRRARLLPFKVKFNPNFMGRECSISLTDFSIEENHPIVIKIMDFITEQARK